MTRQLIQRLLLEGCKKCSDYKRGYCPGAASMMDACGPRAGRR